MFFSTARAFEDQGVIPDIVTIGKPMGNGFPVAAVYAYTRLKSI